MGDRFSGPITCPRCSEKDEYYYAPTCGFTVWQCPKCGMEVDLEELTGISYEDASNREQIAGIIKRVK